MEETLLFRSFKCGASDFDSEKYPATRFIGYGPNQKAVKEMADGYFWGASILSQSQFTQGQKSQQNSLYPIFFLYRHSIELMLKASVLNLYLLKDKPLTKEMKQNVIKQILDHNLLKLLNKISERTCKYSKCQDIIKRLQPYIEEFTELDPISIDFRYATDRSFFATNSQITVKGYDLMYTFEKMTSLWEDLNELYFATEEIWKGLQKL